MNFSEVIEGLKEGKSFDRISWNNGNVIVKQIPADIPTQVIPQLKSLPEGIKAQVGTVGDCQLHYRCQVIQIHLVDGDENVATYYQPTWDDIFADDWRVR